MAFKPKPKTGSAKTGTAASFKYQARSADAVARRASQTGSGKEGFAKPGLPTWTPSDGENKIRILPPTWDDAEHFGLDVYVHYGVGPDQAAFVCRSKQAGEACPVCEGRAELDAAGDGEAAREFLPKKRVAMWIIDRDHSEKGPQIWFAPYTLDQDIARASMDDDGGSLPVDHPEDGFDVIFMREKGTKNSPPKYTGVRLARKASPISDDADFLEKVFEVISENPVPETFVMHDYETMAAAFEGKPRAAAGAEKPKPSFGKTKTKAEPEPEPEKTKTKPSFGKTKTKAEPEPEPKGDELPTWDEVHEMDEDTLTEFAETMEIEFGDTEFEDLAAVADFVCEKLEIEDEENKSEPEPEKTKTKPSFGKTKTKAEPEPEPEKTKAGSWKDKLAKFKK